MITNHTHEEMRTLKLSTIVYDCDLTLPEHREIIPLGVIVEVVIPHIRGLGLIAKKTLTDDEIGKLDEFGKRMLDNPFERLSASFDDAWENSNIGYALEYLAELHPWSFRVEQPVCLEIPDDMNSENVTKSCVRNYLGDLLEEYFDREVSTKMPQAELIKLDVAA